MNDKLNALADFGPSPLSAEVQDETALNGGNVHVAARSLALHRAPPDVLPPGVKKARLKLDAATAEQERAKDKLAEQDRAWADYRGKCDLLTLERQTLAAQEQFLERAKFDIASFPADFAQDAQKLRTERPDGMFARLDSLAKAKAIAELLPAEIAKQRERIQTLEAEIQKLEQLYGE